MHRFANPTRFFDLADRLAPWFAALAALAMAAGLYGAWAAPADYQQGDYARIMYVHVPAAWMSTMIYAGMALASVCWLVWRHSLADLAARASAGIGAVFALLTLVTGSLWGQPTWGTWWVWDARLTSVLILFFIYMGYIMLARTLGAGEQASKSLAILALVGAVNLPIIKFSVEWWNTLHQPASLLRMGGPSIDGRMLWPLLAMILSFTLFYLWLLAVRMKTLFLERKILRLQSVV